MQLIVHLVHRYGMVMTDQTFPLRASSSQATSVLASAARQRSSRCGQ